MSPGHTAACALVVLALAALAPQILKRVERNDAAGSANAAASAERASSPSRRNAAGAASIPRDARGQFWVDARINDRSVRALVDTGASAVALPADMARRLGVRVEPADFVVPVETAGGRVMAAQVRLERIAVAGLEERHVDALIVRDGLTTPLLGMTYLERFARIEATPDVMILRR